MKLLLITAIAEFEKEVKQILKKAQVATYSFKEVTSYRDASNDAIETNWFGIEMNESESILFYAFVLKKMWIWFLNWLLHLTPNKKRYHTFTR